MLTIHNYKKLELHNIGVGKWYVSAIYEQNKEYTINLRSPEHQETVYLSRIAKVLPDGRKVYQYYDRNGSVTLRSVTIDFIQNPSNLLRSLKGFCL
jgi:cytosine/adenosine deaminase-related metal-dependent hydrolase